MDSSVAILFVWEKRSGLVSVGDGRLVLRSTNRNGEDPSARYRNVLKVGLFSDCFLAVKSLISRTVTL